MCVKGCFLKNIVPAYDEKNDCEEELFFMFTIHAAFVLVCKSVLCEMEIRCQYISLPHHIFIFVSAFFFFLPGLMIFLLLFAIFYIYTAMGMENFFFRIRRDWLENLNQ